MAVVTRSSPLTAQCSTLCSAEKTPTPLHHAAALPLLAKYQSEISHNVSDVRGGRAGCLDFEKVAYAGHGLSVLLTAEVDGKSRTYVTQSNCLHKPAALYASEHQQSLQAISVP
jgi:hypothetical protein